MIIFPTEPAHLWRVDKHGHFKVAVVAGGNTELGMVAGSVRLMIECHLLDENLSHLNNGWIRAEW